MVTQALQTARGDVRDGWYHFPIRVYYSETDAGGVVYHGTWFALAERARTEMLRELGIGVNEVLEQHGMIFAIRASQIDWLRPARVDDLLISKVRVIETRNSSMTIEQHFEREGETLCSLTLRVVCVKYPEWKAARIPQPVRDAMAPITLEAA